jgi:hypothetical protein
VLVRKDQRAFADGPIPARRKPPFPSGGAMIVLALMLILAGSFAGAIVLWLWEASFWGIALGYVAGGWVGLLVGMPMVMLVRFLLKPRRKGRPLPTGMKRQHSQGR